MHLIHLQRTPPFTREVQQWIWERQNPPPYSCQSHQFLLGYSIPEQGMGSSLHVAAALLGNALQYDHIFMWHHSEPYVGEEYVDPGCGRNETYTNFDCLFERPTICTAADATEVNSVGKDAFFPGAVFPSSPPHLQEVDVGRIKLRLHKLRMSTAYDLIGTETTMLSINDDLPGPTTKKVLCGEQGLQVGPSSQARDSESTFERRLDGATCMEPEPGARVLGTAAEGALPNLGGHCQRSIHEGMVASASRGLPGQAECAHAGGGQGLAAEP